MQQYVNNMWVELLKISHGQLFRMVSIIGAGALIASFVTLVMYGFKSVWVVLMIAGLLVLLPSFFIKDIKLYWLAIFLFALQFDVKKTLTDGLKLLETLKIDYIQFVFVPEIRASDLPLFILLAIWANELYFGKKKFLWPSKNYLALGFIGWAALSMFKAPHVYLSIVELFRQFKFFLIYLYSVDNLHSKRVVKLICTILLATLVLQGAITLARYKLQYFEPILGETFGRDYTGEKEQRQLIIDPSVGGLKASYGTTSAGMMAQYFLMLLPLALMLCCKNPVFLRRWIFFLGFMVGSLALYLTYSKTNLIAFVVELVLCYYFSVRRGYISKNMALCWFFVAILATLVVSPTLYAFANRKVENVTIRIEQYKTAISMSQSNPVLGVGLNNSMGLTKTYTKESYSFTDPIKRHFDQPIHSFYLTLLSEIGIVGFILYLSFFITICRDALRLSRSATDPEIAFFSTGLLATFIGLATGILANPFYEDSVQTLLWLYAGMIVAFSRIEKVPNKGRNESFI